MRQKGRVTANSTMIRASRAGWMLNAESAWCRRIRPRELIPPAVKRSGVHLFAASSRDALVVDDEVQRHSRELRALARAEAAEADNSRLRDELAKLEYRTAVDRLNRATDAEINVRFPEKETTDV